MAALSRQFSTIGFTGELPIGTPPLQDTGEFLSRKVKSELDLANLGVMGISTSVPHSIDSGFSRTGDPLPDELESSATLDPGIDCDAFVALQELGSLVARRKGINTSQFINGLLQLLVMAENTAEDNKEPELGHDTNGDYNNESASDDVNIDETLTPKHRLRNFKSQPQLGSDQRRRRHFSFEPGDDKIRNLDDDTMPCRTIQRTSSTESTCSDLAHEEQESSTLQMQPKPSKIPSPVQTPGLGSVRSKNSLPGLQHDHRRTSTSSVLTAFRQSSNASLHPLSKSKDNSVAAIAAARAARSSGMVRSENGSPRERPNDHV
jgi:hypothetical protein